MSDRAEPSYYFKFVPMAKWKHIKSGNIYVVVGNCFIESTCTPAVMYERESYTDPVVWVRPATEFRERFEIVS